MMISFIKLSAVVVILQLVHGYTEKDVDNTCVRDFLRNVKNLLSEGNNMHGDGCEIDSGLIYLQVDDSKYIPWIPDNKDGKVKLLFSSVINTTAITKDHYELANIYYNQILDKLEFSKSDREGALKNLSRCLTTDGFDVTARFMGMGCAPSLNNVFFRIHHNTRSGEISMKAAGLAPQKGAMGKATPSLDRIVVLEATNVESTSEQTLYVIKRGWGRWRGRAGKDYGGVMEPFPEHMRIIWNKNKKKGGERIKASDQCHMVASYGKGIYKGGGKATSADNKKDN